MDHGFSRWPPPPLSKITIFTITLEQILLESCNWCLHPLFQGQATQLWGFCSSSSLSPPPLSKITICTITLWSKPTISESCCPMMVFTSSWEHQYPSHGDGWYVCHFYIIYIINTSLPVIPYYMKNRSDHRLIQTIIFYPFLWIHDRLKWHSLKITI